ncbi:two-component system sensor histidine kinase NtrB [Thermosulfuriphilus sp.]
MASGLPLFPLYLVDFIGALVMLFFAFWTSIYSWRLVRKDPTDILWRYLFWLSMGLVGLSISRAAGHVTRFVLLSLELHSIWLKIAPYTGALNTIFFIAVAVSTFYYQNFREAVDRLKRFNIELERRIEERTQELLLSEQKFHRLFENSKDMIYFCNEYGHITDINPAGAAMLGYEEDELVNTPLWRIIAQAEDWEIYYTQLCQKGHVIDFETQLLRKDGSICHVLITASAIKDEKGHLVGCEGIAKDMTRFREMTQQLIQSEKLASIGQLAAGVAHEINTPLGIILGYTQILEEDFSENPEAREYLEIIEKQTKICRRIVGDLLRFARLGKSGQGEVDINLCVKEVASILSHTLSIERISLEFKLDPTLPKIVGDEEKIRQVLVNLVTNAFQAIGHDGRIEIHTSYDQLDEEIVIKVADTGPGIPPEIINKIFDPFFTTKEVGQGTGLGLSVSFGIVKDHGGRIYVESPPADEKLKKKGLRTVFYIRLPIHGRRENGFEGPNQS